jgi:hypothetical protein
MILRDITLGFYHGAKTLVPGESAGVGVLGLNGE